jgi:hypothetical protein
MGGFVKDVFGVKAVVGDPAAVRALHDALLKLQWTAAVLEKYGSPRWIAPRASSSSR